MFISGNLRFYKIKFSRFVKSRYGLQPSYILGALLFIFALFISFYSIIYSLASSRLLSCTYTIKNYYAKLLLCRIPQNNFKFY